MKLLKLIIFFYAAFYSSILSQFNLSAFYPSFYYTRGSYSNDDYSNSYSLYSTLEFDYIDYINLRIDKMDINSTDWKYDQYTLIGGIVKNLYPFYLKINTAYIDGKFNWKPEIYSYNDKINIYSMNLIYNYNLFFFGGSVSYFNIDGFNSINNRQYELDFTWLFSEVAAVSLKLAHSNLTDDRKLYSFGIDASYDITDNLYLNIQGFIGERAYYFDNKLLVIYNQNETQKDMFEVKLDYAVSSYLDLIGGYQKTSFTAYDINYYIFGLRAKL